MWVACLLLAAAPAKGDSTELDALRAEIRQLATEFAQWKIRWITAQLELVRMERQRLGAERQGIEREIGELNLASTNQASAEDESRKEELTVQLSALVAKEQAARHGEADLAAALNAESARLREIQEKARRVAQ